MDQIPEVTSARERYIARTGAKEFGWRSRVIN